MLKVAIPFIFKSKTAKDPMEFYTESFEGCGFLWVYHMDPKQLASTEYPAILCAVLRRSSASKYCCGRGIDVEVRNWWQLCTKRRAAPPWRWEDPDLEHESCRVLLLMAHWCCWMQRCNSKIQIRSNLPISGKKHDCSRVSSSLTIIPFRPLKKGFVMCTSISVCRSYLLPTVLDLQVTIGKDTGSPFLPDTCSESHRYHNVHLEFLNPLRLMNLNDTLGG